MAPTEQVFTPSIAADRFAGAVKRGAVLVALFVLAAACGNSNIESVTVEGREVDVRPAGSLDLAGLAPLSDTYNIKPSDGDVATGGIVTIQGERPPDGEIIAAAHLDGGGQLRFHDVMWNAGTNAYQFQTPSFSLFGIVTGAIGDFASAATDSVFDSVTGRTDPPECRDDAPDWARHSGPLASGAAHVCWQTNADHGVELFLKSNRSKQTLVVSVPASAAFVWVDGQPAWLRQYAVSVAGSDPQTSVLLPPGGEMSMGFSQPEAALSLEVAVFQTPGTIIFDGARYATDLVVDTSDADLRFFLAAVTIDRCFGLGVGDLTVPDSVDFVQAFRCAIEADLGDFTKASIDDLVNRRQVSSPPGAIQQLLDSKAAPSWIAKTAKVLLTAAAVISTVGFAHDQIVTNLLGVDRINMSFVPTSAAGNPDTPSEVSSPLEALQDWFEDQDAWREFYGAQFGLDDCANANFDVSHCYLTETADDDRYVFLIGSPESHIDVGVLIEQPASRWLVIDDAPYTSPAPAWLAAVSDLSINGVEEGFVGDGELQLLAEVAVETVLFNAEGDVFDGDRGPAQAVLLDAWGTVFGAESLEALASSGVWSFSATELCDGDGSTRLCEVRAFWAPNDSAVPDGFLPPLFVWIDEDRNVAVEFLAQ